MYKTLIQKKEVVALGQTYFAIQTRKQELSEKEYSELTEDEKRFYQRNLTRKGNYSLNITARNAGVNIKKIYMESDELIANLFRISQIEQKLKNENKKLE